MRPTSESTEITIKSKDNVLTATLNLEWDGIHRITYTAPISPGLTPGQIEILMIEAVRDRLTDMLPAEGA